MAQILSKLVYLKACQICLINAAKALKCSNVQTIIGNSWPFIDSSDQQQHVDCSKNSSKYSCNLNVKVLDF